MNKNHKQYLKDEIHESFDQLDDLDLSDEHMAAVRERAFQLYQIHMKIEEIKAIRRKQRLHRVITTVGVAFAIMVVSFVYIALTPSFVSEANETMTIAVRRVKEWMHLDIENHVPYNRESIISDGTYSDFLSVEDYMKYYQYPIAYFADSQFPSPAIHVELLQDIIEQVTVSYRLGRKEIRIVSTLLQDDTTIYLNNQDMQEIMWQDTPVYCWTTSDGIVAICYYHGVSIRINADDTDESWLESHLSALAITPQE